MYSLYFEVAGCNKKRVFGTGRYSKAFLQQLESTHQRCCSSSRRVYEFCIYWDEQMRKWLSSQGHECPSAMPLVDESLMYEDPDSYPKTFEDTWLSFFKSHGIDAEGFFPQTEFSSQGSQESNGHSMSH
ncbi:unnamed protein product [Cuscuta epithymum]|uniref:Uncharacterized protein n=1 Tax=Cuscuta epithymum TaxID=186058 RepID=A0AAV0DCK7_9ASTE|nr:unnamed protein product [Cuscuta epithymum]